MVFILQRYIFRELLKVFILATIALTLIMSLGSILRPIQEFGVSPGQVLNLLAYFIPITLTFVLPLAGLFAMTLVYGRFAGDNELDACKASGVSLFTLVYPGMILAIIIAIANLFLSFHVVPDFFHRAERSLKADAKQILFRNIQRHGFYSLPPHGERKIYADRADLDHNILEGVIVTEVEGGKIVRSITTESALVNFQIHDRFNEVQIVARHVYQIGSENEPWFYSELLPVRTEFSSMLADDIKFKKLTELKRIHNNPMLFYPVKEIADDAFRQYSCELLYQDIKKTIKDVNDFYELTGDPNSAAFTLSNLQIDDKKDKPQIKLSGDIIIRQFDTSTGKTNKTWSCTKAVLSVEGKDISNLKLTIELFSPRWKNADGSAGIAAGRQFIRGLSVPDAVKSKLDSSHVLSTIEPKVISSSLSAGPSKKLVGLLEKLRKKISRVFIDITAELHTRLVFGIGCLPLIMIGISLGIILRGGHLLSAFGASAIPAGMLVICIMMGQNLAKNPSGGLVVGVLLMWSGFVLLTAIAAGLLYRLLKN